MIVILNLRCRGPGYARRSVLRHFFRIGILAMVVSWDKTADRIWFGTWGDGHLPVLLYLVAERLPDLSGWDWAVWQPQQPMIVRRGIAPSASRAAAAAEAAAAQWAWGSKTVPDA
jgi:hypothetical protein